MHVLLIKLEAWGGKRNSICIFEKPFVHCILEKFSNDLVQCNSGESQYKYKKSPEEEAHYALTGQAKLYLQFTLGQCWNKIRF